MKARFVHSHIHLAITGRFRCPFGRSLNPPLLGLDALKALLTEGPGHSGVGLQEPRIRKLKKAVAVSGNFSGVPEDNSGSLRKIVGIFSPNRKALSILGFRERGKANLPGTLGRQ